jgi:hypothetical protein
LRRDERQPTTGIAVRVKRLCTGNLAGKMGKIIFFIGAFDCKPEVRSKYEITCKLK